MKTNPSMAQNTSSRQPRAVWASPTPPKSELASPRPAHPDQRRVFWFFIFSFSLVLHYGGCARAADARLVKSQAEKGDVTAQYALGRMYAQGDGAGQNFGKAVKWYRKAAEQNLAQAQFQLGRLYASGEGAPQDYAGALKWFRRAAAQDYAPAKNRLGLAYQHGQGIRQDCVEAYKWFTLAADDANGIYAVANRETLALGMTSEQIAEAHCAPLHFWQGTNLLTNTSVLQS